MNKYDRAKIKQSILTQIESLRDKMRASENPPATKLRLERLGTALKRIEAKNFGACFKCEKPIPKSLLLAFPETMLCTDCLNETGEQT